MKFLERCRCLLFLHLELKMIENQIKTVALLGLLTGLLVWAGNVLGGYQGLLIGVAFALVMNIASFWFSDRIVLMMYRAKEAPKAAYSQLHHIVEDVARAAGLPKPKVYIIPTMQSNAFATGRNKKHAVVAVTQGIMKLLSPGELKGVIAHEISHVKNRDVLVGTIAAVLAGVISYVAIVVRWGAIFGGMGGRGGRNHNLLELLLIAILAPILAMIIRLAISRSREYLADERGARIIKNPQGLASALQKMENSAKHTPIGFGSEMTSHLFIVNPFRTKNIMKLFSTHPATEERIKRLKALKF